MLELVGPGVLLLRPSLRLQPGAALITEPAVAVRRAALLLLSAPGQGLADTRAARSGQPQDSLS